MRFAEVEKRIKSGDILLWCGRGLFSPSWWIARATLSRFTHTAMAVVRDGEVHAAEMVFTGGQVLPLEPQVRQFPGQWVWRPVRSEFVRSYDGEGAALVMCQLAKQKYGRADLFVQALKYVPGLRLLLGARDEDDTALRKRVVRREGLFSRQMYCSEAFSLAAQLGGGIDPVQCRSYRFVAPSDTAESLLFDARRDAVLVP